MNAPLPTLDPLDWNTIQPVVDDLLATNLTPDTLAAWLGR